MPLPLFDVGRNDPAQRRAADAACVETLRDGTQVLVRPICVGDIDLERRFIEDLSPTARRFRFLDSMRSPSVALLEQLTLINPATDAAFVAILGEEPQQREIGVARFSAQPDRHDCEFAIAIADEWQCKGLGTLLMQRLIDVARSRGLTRLHAISAADNERMRKLARHLQFHAGRDPDDPSQAFYTLDL